MTKKLAAILLGLTMVFSLAACGNAEAGDNVSVDAGQTEQESSEPETSDAETNVESTESAEGAAEANESGNVLVAYFSRTGENYGVGNIEKGNTAIIAEMIAEQTSGELFEIRTVDGYPESYDETVEIAQEELNTGARPELAENLESLDGYDVIFLGYPNWWGDMPMAVYTFLESHDFSGKTIIPFCTHAGSGLGSTEGSIADTCSGAEVLDGFSIAGTTAQNEQEEARTAVTEFLQESGF